ncbi:MAG: type II toxin-antitoxin system VapC family toxin [Rhodocyclales bacterium]|nr:type II toxin-antitoxin system VapC family toxin [Rhodocyclales bacterium]
MSGVVIDCSVAAAWLLGEDDAAESLIAAGAEGGIHVPALWHLELANVLLVALKRKRLTAAEARTAERLAAALPVATDSAPPPLGILFALGREYDLTAYDAAYLELALRLDLPLATFDAALARAARKAGATIAGD